MASLVESLTQALTPDLIGKIGGVTGLDANLTSKGLEVVGPLLTGALAQVSSTPQGLDGVMKLLPAPGTGVSAVGNLASRITGGDAPTSMLAGMFGTGLSAITGTLDRALGFKVSPLIGVAAPMVLNLIGQRANEQKLDPGGVARLLQDEQTALVRKGGPTAQVITQALNAGKEAAATKAKYAADVWSKVRLAPVAAAELVMGASPSGTIGTTKEVMALGDAIQSGRADAAPASVLNLAFDADVSEAERQTLGADETTLIGVIKDAAAAVLANSPADAAGYARTIVDVATRVAEASKEGGFLGIGGTRVSEREQAAIDRIKTAVGLQSMTAGTRGP